MAHKQYPFLHDNKENVYNPEKAASSYWLGSGFYGNGVGIFVFGHRELRVCVDVMYSTGMCTHMAVIRQTHTCRDAAGISCVSKLDV